MSYASHTEDDVRMKSTPSFEWGMKNFLKINDAEVLLQ